MGVLDDHVVLICGGGRGIGREIALLAAREGARVVVNDLGSTLDGRAGDGTDPAEATAREIRAAGGDAVFNTMSITDFDSAHAMVAQAIDTFGDLHAVINPAGILRDGMFHKSPPADWNAVVDVHLGGAFNVSRAAVAHFRERGGGSFVHFSSTSGLVGNIGQASYAAAKMGVAGLSRVLALEGAAKNVRSNVIAPSAFTRMIESVPTSDEASRIAVDRRRRAMRPEQIAPLAVALASQRTAHISGQIFGARGNEVLLYDQPRPVMTIGRADGWSPTSLIEQGLPAMTSRFSRLMSIEELFPHDPL